MKNRYGVDVDYFKKNLDMVIRDIDNYTPDELSLAFHRLSEVASNTIHKYEIVGVSLKRGGEMYSLPKPSRHHDVIKMMVENHNFNKVGGDFEQGFYDRSGAFLNREYALIRAFQTKQITKSLHLKKLFSEDLW